MCVFSSISSITGADRSQLSDVASQQTLQSVVGVPRLEETSDQTQPDPDPGPSYQTWPTLPSDSVAVVQPAAGSEGVSDGTENVGFVL